MPSLLGKIARVPLRLVPRMTPLKILTGPLAGKRWLSTSGTHGCWIGTYERELQQEIATSLKPGDVFYDLGANVGFFSLLATACVGPFGKVISFEPLPRNIGLLRRNMALNGAEFTLIEAAVSDHCGSARFAQAGPSQGSLGDGDLEVRVVKLDELNLPAPTHMKIDIEGGESKALIGARGLLLSAKPIIFLSTHGYRQHEVCCAFLSSIGYRLSVRRDGSIDGQYELIARP